MLDKDGIPIPSSSNNWLPIQGFKPQLFADHSDFLVWLIDEEGNGFMNVAQYAPKDMATFIRSDIAPFEDAEYHITGEWRHIDHLAKIEPVAWRPMLEGPNIDRLKQIVEVYHKAA